MESLLVKVEQRHIDAGDKGDCNLCPIALAILETGQVLDVAVGDSSTCVDVIENGKVKIIHFITPAEATNFILKFDTGLAVEPFEFTLKELYPEAYVCGHTCN